MRVACLHACMRAWLALLNNVSVCLRVYLSERTGRFNAMQRVREDEAEEELQRIAEITRRVDAELDMQLLSQNVGLRGTDIPVQTAPVPAAVVLHAVTHVEDLVVGGFYSTNVDFTAIAAEKWIVRVDAIPTNPPPRTKTRQHAVWSKQPVVLTWYNPHVTRADTFTLHLSREDRKVAGTVALTQWVLVPVHVESVGPATDDTICVQ